MVGIGPGPDGDETGKLGLTDRIVRDQLPKIALEDVEHLRGWEVHVVQIRMVGEAVSPVRAVQLLNTLELRVAVEKEELRGVQIAIVIDLTPAAGRHINCG